MANEYDAVLNEPQDQPSENSYSDLMDAHSAAINSGVRAATTLATDTNPDEIARHKRISELLGWPLQAVKSLPQDANRQLQINTIEQNTQNAPVLRRKYTDADFAALAKDDSSNLSGIESALNPVKSAVRSAFAGATADIASGTYGVFETLLKAASPLADPLAGVVLPENPLRKGAQFFEGLRKQNQNLGDRIAGDQSQNGIVQNSINSGFRSFGQMIAPMAASLLTENPSIALGAAGSLQGSMSATKALDQGKSPIRALTYGLEDAAAEVATEKLPIATLFKDVKAGSGFFKTLGHQIATEVPAELGATAWQNFNEWANLHPEKSMGDYVSELPEAEAQTLIATLTTSVLFSAMGHGASRLARRYAPDQEKADHAETAAQSLQSINDLAKSSKLLERDPSSFQEFVQQASEEGPVSHVYIDANTLMQSGLGEQIAQDSPSVAEQLPQALASGGQVSIPVDEYATNIAPKEYSQNLIDYLKVDPEGFSREEAQRYIAEHSESVKQEIERLLSEKQGDDTFKQSADAVKQEIKSQLDQAGRFTSDVNDQYASMMSKWYAVQAGKLGVTPQELFKSYSPTIVAQGMFGNDAVLNQDNEVLTLNALQNKWSNAGIDGAISERGGVITLSKIIVPESGRNQGKGTDAMQALVDYADATGQHIVLSPSTDFGGNKKRLINFYKRFGFVENKGGKRAFSTSETMYREAKGKVLYQDHPVSYKKDKNVINEAFKKWFGESKVVDAEGKPLVVYHGTRRQFDAFEPMQPIAAPGNPKAIYFTSDKSEAKEYAADTYGDMDERSRLVPVYLKIENDSDGIIKKRNVRGEDVYEYAVFKPENIKSAIGNRGTFDPNDPNILNQTERGFYNPDTRTIGLLKNADLSTFLHESGHFFLEAETHFASLLEAKKNAGEVLTDGEQSILDDMYKLLKWFDVPNLTEWNRFSLEEKRDMHEKFARGFEAYLFEGKSPSIEIAGVFQRFRAWLLNVYRELKNLNVELTDEVRGVFDRMLATNEEITLAEYGRSMMPMFSTPEQAGMTPEEFKAYHDQNIEGTQDAIDNLQSRSLRDMKWLQNAKSLVLKNLQNEAKEKRSEVRMEVRTEVMSQPIYRAWSFLTGKATSEEVTAGKLNLSAMRESGVSEEIINTLKARRMTSSEGIAPDLIADMFGFTSGDQLVRELASVPTPNEAIESMTDQRMFERYADLHSPEAINQAADMAIHNDARARFVATEANALERAAGQRKTLTSLAKQYASEMVSRVKIRNLKPSQYAAAEVRAAREAEKAYRKNDIAKAAAEKRNQVVQMYATKEAYRILDEVDSAIRYLRKFDSEGTRKNIDAEYTDQIDNILERFDLRKNVSIRSLDKQRSLLDWLKSQREQGFEPDIPPEVENEAYRKSYKEMTIDELRGVVDSVKQIEHLGRLKRRLLTSKDKRDYEAVRDEIVQSVNAHAGDRKADTRTPTTNFGRALQGIKRFWAAHIKVATYARVMDGGKDGGPMWEYFIRAANERGDMETTMRAEATKALTEIMAPVFKLGRMGGTGQYFESINRSLNREARLTIALNTGNEGNLQRLLGGEGWQLDQIMPVLKSLTAEEWQAVQKVWDHFESYRPQIAEKERRIYGKEPEWVKPEGFKITLNDGNTVELKGGYYPIKYDPAASQRAEEHTDAEAAKRQLQGAYTTATTRRSFTKSRVTEVNGRPLLYTLSGMYSGVNDVIHDLAWHEWLIDVNRLLKSSSIDSAIREHYGPEVKAQFKSWVQDVAEGEKGADSAVDIALSRLRQGISAGGLGFNVMSAVMQPLGITQSMVRIGKKWAARGVTAYISDARGLTKTVNEKSEFMRNRSRTRFRELNELRNRVQDQSTLNEVIGKHAFFLMMRCQQMVDVPTWQGAYEKALASGENDDRAISLADQAVIDSQGGGQTKDLSAIERGGPAQKLFTVFYSFMNTALNIGIERGMTEKARGKLAADYLLLFVVPVVLAHSLKAALIPSGGDDDFDIGELANKLLAEEIDYLMGLMVVVREFSEAAKTITGANDLGRDYTGPAGLRLITDSVQLSKQVHQGEFDDGFRKAAVNVVGDMFGLPAAQLNRTFTGIEALSEGKTDNPTAVVFGFKKN